MAEPRTVLYSCPRPDGPPLYFPLGHHDVSALKVQAPLTLGYHFCDHLDPLALCQSLSVLLRTFPALAGCLVLLDDAFHVRAHVHDAEVQALETPRSSLTAPSFWHHITTQLPLRRGTTAGGRFYQVLLLHTCDPSDGCTLLVTLDHALADAFTCALVMETWSRLHQEMTAAAAVAALREHPPLPVTLPTDFEIECEEESLVVRRLFFHPSQFASLKAKVNASANTDVTTNDMVMAICVCAVARFAERTAVEPFVSTMADARGRGLPSGMVGNGARALRLPLTWEVAMSQDLSAVASALRAGTVAGLDGLLSRCQSDEQSAPLVSTLQETGAVGRWPQVNPIDSDALLYFNSWARQRRLVEADFGARLAHFEWVTLFSLQRRRSFVVVPVHKSGVLALQACLPRLELEYLCQLWDFFRTPINPPMEYR
eukprot:GGOE01037470.1.p1 GENE.GGOE01037470.1~~GGOE01037470.1.p1  ORF type:complete len:428 (-),score=84.15 GGOE01037470.1:109-1392(-)